MMRVIPLTLAQANALVRDLHRHHKPVIGHRFSLGVEVDGKLVGAAIVGRPVAPELSHYEIAEVTRLVTDGTKNACSILYATAARVAREMGFARIQTYILDSEPGTSLRASGWTFDQKTKGGDRWNDPARKGQLDFDGRVRRGDQPICDKQRWVKQLTAPHPTREAAG